MKKIGVFTGTRAEYGLLKPLIKEIALDRDNFDGVVIASGTHLSPEFGKTIDQIDDLLPVEAIETLLSSDTSVGVAKSFGLGVLGYTEVLARIKPDCLLIVGDRYEALACAITAVMLGIPIAHVHGGEISEGSYDEYYRHAITKLSRLHFTSTEQYRQRVIQMGEQPSTVFNVGAIGLDNVRLANYLDRPALEMSLGIKLAKRVLLITYHPEHTVGTSDLRTKFLRFLSGLVQASDAQLIFTKANADANGRMINQMIDEFVAKNSDRAVLFDSLGLQRYFSLLRFVEVVIGNSSSGLIEVPSFGIPSINVGRRQDGRFKGLSIIDCEEEDIEKAIEKSNDPQFRTAIRQLTNPYGTGDASKQIAKELRTFACPTSIKKFYDLEVTL